MPTEDEARRPPTTGGPKTFQIAIRLPDNLVARMDEYTERLKTDTPWVTVTRADAMRALLVRGLLIAEGVSE